MRATINHNGVDVEIQLTPEQEALVSKQAKPKFTLDLSNKMLVDLIYYCTDSAKDEAIFVEHGRYRKTEQAAEQSLARNKRANRLEALAEQLGGLTEFKYGSENSYIFHTGNQWYTDIYHTNFSPERVYMTKECAIDICRMLNEGEFSLDGAL